MNVLKPLVVEMLEARGLKISEETYQEKEELWDFIKASKQQLDKEDVEENPIALRSIPGGDHIE